MENHFKKIPLWVHSKDWSRMYEVLHNLLLLRYERDTRRPFLIPRCMPYDENTIFDYLSETLVFDSLPEMFSLLTVNILLRYIPHGFL